MTEQARRRHRWWWAAAVAVIIALLVTGVVGRDIWTNLHPSAVANVGVGERVEVDGVAYTVARFDRVAELPPVDPEDPPVTAPEGTQIVIVLIDIQPIGNTDTAENYCDFTLTNAEGTMWRPDSDWTYGARLPDNRSCTPPNETPEGRPWPVGQPYQSVAVFVVPRSMSEELIFEITWSSANRKVTVRP